MLEIRPITIEYSAKNYSKKQGHHFDLILVSMDFTKYRKIYTKWNTRPSTFIWHMFFFFCENHTIQNLAQNDAIAFYYQFFSYIKQ